MRERKVGTQVRAEEDDWVTRNFPSELIKLKETHNCTRF